MRYLDVAAELAAQVDWRDVYPNPRVGCVIVQDGEVLSTGVHKKYGGAHAEVNALENLKLSNCKRQTLNGEGCINPGFEIYITLEPCDNFPGKKTGSCTQKLLDLNPKKIVIGSLDKRFGGKNVDKLKAAGIKVEVVHHKKSADLSRVKPHLILKLAQTLDGKISKGGVKDIISSEESRKKVHQLRSEVDALLTTTSTLKQDDPLLDCRFVNKKVAQKLFIFGKSEIKENLNIFHNKERNILRFSGDDLVRDLREISEMGVKTLLTECGATMATSLLQVELVEEIWLFVAPKIFGKGISTFSAEIPLNSFSLNSVEESGGDVLMKFIKA